MKRIATLGSPWSFLSVFMLFSAFSLRAQYTLTVEAAPAVTQVPRLTLLLTCRINGPQSACLATTSEFDGEHPGGGIQQRVHSWNASGVNPALLPFS